MLDRLGSRRRPGPPVTPIFEAWFENIADGTIPGHLIATLWRQMLGYGLAVVIGITLGLAMGYYRLLYNLFEPLVEVLRPIPGPTYLPILVLLAHRHVLMPCSVYCHADATRLLISAPPRGGEQ